MILTFPDMLPQIATPTRGSTKLHLCVQFVNFASSTLNIPALAKSVEGRQLRVLFVNFGLVLGFQVGLMEARFTVQFVNFDRRHGEIDAARDYPPNRCFTVQFVNFAEARRFYLSVLTQNLSCKPWRTKVIAALHRYIAARYYFDYSRNMLDAMPSI